MLEALNFSALFSLEGLSALLALSALEIVLGVDNVVFLAVLTGRLPEHQRRKAERIGLLLAMLMRIVLLFGVFWVMKLTNPLFTVAGVGISWKDIVLISGGLFLLWKAIHEIHAMLDLPSTRDVAARKAKAAFAGVIMQVVLMDMIFSLDSVITAVGMTEILSVMIIAVVLAISVMMIFASSISRFVEKHPTTKMLALSFLVLIGVLLIADGVHQHISRSYVYAAMGFALLVEILNLRAAKARKVKAAMREAESEAA